MDTRRDGDILHGRFEPGIDLHDAYRKLMRNEDVTAGYVVSGIGMLKDPELGYFLGDGAYDREVLEGRYELLSTSGNLATHGDDPYTHLHVTLGTPDHTVVGGHLFEASVEVTHEFAVRALPEGSLLRRENPSTGLLDLCPR